MGSWSLCLSATIGYSTAGLVYEWSHYIVHTRVKPPQVSATCNSTMAAVVPIMSKLFIKMRDNHKRHHKVDGDNWFAFSVPVMDDMFGTNPSMKEVMEARRLSKESTN